MATGGKLKALQEWCKVRCEGYRDVTITNMTSSWKSGLAFCAIIHRYRPDLINYDSLRKEDVFENSKLAFSTAQEQLGIPALLDPEDMVAMRIPDKLSICTYVSQYYNYFHNKPIQGGPKVRSSVHMSRSSSKRKSTDPSQALSSSHGVNGAPDPKTNRVSAANSFSSNKEDSEISTMDDGCFICKQKVYLLERFYVKGRLCHRSCQRDFEKESTLKRNQQLQMKEQEWGKQNSLLIEQKKMEEAAKNDERQKLGNILISKRQRDSINQNRVSEESNYSIIGFEVVSDNDVKKKKEYKQEINRTRTPSSSSPKGLLDQLFPSPQTFGFVKETPVVFTSDSRTKPASSGEIEFNEPPIEISGDIDSLKSDLLKSSQPSSASVFKTSVEIRPSPQNLSTNAQSLFNQNTSSLSQMTSPNVQTKDSNIAPVSVTLQSSLVSPVKELSVSNVGKVPANNISSSSPITINTKAFNSSISTTNILSSPTNFTTSTQNSTFNQNCSSNNLPFTDSRTGSSLPGYESNYVTLSVTEEGLRSPDKLYSHANTSPSPALNSYSQSREAYVDMTSKSLRSPLRESNMNSDLTNSKAAQDKKRLEFLDKEVDNTKPTWLIEAEARCCSPTSPTKRHTPGNIYEDLSVYSAWPSGGGSTTTSAFSFKVHSRMDTSQRTKLSSVNNVVETHIAEPVKKLIIKPANIDQSEQIASNVAGNAQNTLVRNFIQNFNTTMLKELEVSFPDAEFRRQVSPGPEMVSNGKSINNSVNSNKINSPSIRENQEIDQTNSDLNDDVFQTSPNCNGAQNETKSNMKKIMPDTVFNFDNISDTEEDNKERKKSNIVPGLVFSLGSLSEELPDVKDTTEQIRSWLDQSRSKIEGGFQVPIRQINAEKRVPLTQIQSKLEQVDKDLRKVEQKGRDLEEKIRSRDEEEMDEDKDDLMVKWFKLVQQRFDLIREEAELIYRVRQQDLEDVHSEIEHQLRRIYQKKEEGGDVEGYSELEEVLENLLVKIVAERDSIVDSMESDRIRYLQEDEELLSVRGSSNKKSRKKSNVETESKPKKSFLHSLTRRSKSLSRSLESLTTVNKEPTFTTYI